jgi:hypothetical protein
MEEGNKAGKEVKREGREKQLKRSGPTVYTHTRPSHKAARMTHMDARGMTRAASDHKVNRRGLLAARTTGGFVCKKMNFKFRDGRRGPSCDLDNRPVDYQPVADPHCAETPLGALNCLTSVYQNRIR